jgi:hypothetical protein
LCSKEDIERPWQWGDIVEPYPPSWYLLRYVYKLPLITILLIPKGKIYMEY